MIFETTLTTLSLWLIEKVGDKISDHVLNFSEKKDEVDERFLKAIKYASATMQNRYPDALGGDIDIFFSCEDFFDELYKLLFRNSKIDLNRIGDKIDQATLPENFLNEFVTELKKNCLEDLLLEKIFSNNEIYLTIIGIGASIETISKSTLLSQEDIAKIKTILEDQFNTTFSIDKFFEKYSKSALKSLSEVNFIGLGIKSHFKKNRKNLFEVYVHPEFKYKVDEIENKGEEIPKSTLASLYGEESFEKFEEISFTNLFNFNKNIVILGHPGAGKSVLVKYLICQILKKNANVISNSKILECIPFRIELRKYLIHKKEYNEGIIKYLAKTFETEYGLIKLTDSNILKIFESAKVIMFFDGLDEIFNSNDKNEIRTDIGNLIEQFDNISAVATSRFIGYDEVRLSKEKFIELNIQNFNDSQVEEYVKKWYKQEETDADIRENESNDFLSLRKNIDNEIITNPLLLSLIVILFRNNLKLPESKLEIYQSCTKTLVDKWDSSKELRIELNEDIAKKKESLFADLAYWQYTRLSSDSKNITNELACNHITESIISKLKITDDWITAKNYADEFMNYAHKRSLYFDNNFTHKTFLEYYTAYWIFSNIEKKHKKEERNIIIQEYIENPFWHIVLELLINMIDQDQPDNEIVDELIDFQRSNKIEAIPFLLSSVYSLKNKSNSVVSKMIDATLNFLSFKRKKEIELHLQNKLYESLNKYISVNGSALLEEMMTLKLKENLNNIEPLKRLLILYFELCLSLRANLLEFNINILPRRSLLEELVEKDPYIRLIGRSYLRIKGSSDGNIDFTEIIYLMKKYSVNEVFKEYESFFDEFIFLSPFAMYLGWQLSIENHNDFEANLSKLILSGISKERIIKFFKDESFYTFSRGVEINILIEKLNVTNDNFISFILCALIWKKRSPSRKTFKESISRINDESIRKYMESEPPEKLINSLLRKFDLNKN